MESNKALDNNFTNPDGEIFSETMAEYTSVWSNAAAKRYVIRAAQHLKMNREQIKTLLIRMEWAFRGLLFFSCKTYKNSPRNLLYSFDTFACRAALNNR